MEPRHPAMAEQALQLRDIHLPASPPWWPPAPGWWLLGLLLLVLLLISGWWLVRTWRRRRHWNVLQSRLDAIECALSEQPGPEQLASLALLLRRVALERFPREQVAALSGNAWLAFLDRSGGGGAFSDGPGRVLAEGPYDASLDQSLDLPGLMRAVRHWLRQAYEGRT